MTKSIKTIFTIIVAVTDESSAYTYDTFNRLTGVTSGDDIISYIYNADNERISKTVNGVTTNHMWDRGNIVYEADASKNEIERYYYGRRLAESVAGDESKQYDYDPHGSVTHINGMWLYDYDAFGNLRMNLQDISKHLYCGEYYDAETGFIYLRNRYYDPSIGRFITEDPIKDGLNWYVYCENNPVNFVDPLGLSGIKNDGSYYITHPLDKQLLRLKQEYGGASEKRKQEISIEAQNIRNSGTEGIDWSVRADRSLNYYMIDTDITNKLNDLMKTAGDENFWKRFTNLNSVTNAARYADFAWMVRPGGQYDLKSKSEWQGKEHFIYNGEIIWYDDPGNILYGYLGKAMGFEDLTLLSAAGAVQILTGTSSWDYVSSFFDDPRDQKSIKMGIQRFKDTNLWIWW